MGFLLFCIGYLQLRTTIDQRNTHFSVFHTHMLHIPKTYFYNSLLCIFDYSIIRYNHITPVPHKLLLLFHTREPINFRNVLITNKYIIDGTPDYLSGILSMRNLLRNFRSSSETCPQVM